MARTANERERETDRTATIALRKVGGTRKLIFMSEGEEGGDGVVNPKKGIERDSLSGIGMKGSAEYYVNLIRNAST